MRIREAFGMGADVVGQRLDEGPGEPITIVGMVVNVRTPRLADADPNPEV
jgi:hypothetical protein